MSTGLHLLHAGGVGVAVVALLAMLLPSLRGSAEQRRIEDLRRAVAEGRLVELAVVDATRASVDSESGVARVPRVLLVVGCLGAGAVHAAVCPEHFGEAVRLGLFFLVLAVAQLVLAVAAARSPRAAWRAAAVVVAGCALALWVLTRTTVVPWGPPGIERVGAPDLLASSFEVLTVVAGLYALTVPRRAGLPVSSAPAR